MRVLMITCEWPTAEHPEWVPFLVQQVKYLRQTGIELELFAFRGKKNPANYLRAWGRLRRQYDLDTFDVIHAQFGQSGLLAFASGLPLVVTFHGSDLQGFARTHGFFRPASLILRRLSQQVARRAREIIVVAQHLRRYLPPLAPVHVIPCGLDLALFRPMAKAEARRQLDLPADKRLILFAANPQRAVKRFHLAEAAVSRLTAKFDVALTTMTGVPHPMVPIYMNACDALVLTSKHEGSPTVVKEALACNLPVVSVDVGDVRQRIGAVDGCVVCADDWPATIAVGLQQVLNRTTPFEGRSAVRSLDESLLVGQIVSVYEQAVARPYFDRQKNSIV